MKQFLWRTGLILMISIMIMVFAGCSTDTNPVASSEPQAVENPYPVLSEEQINSLIPGYQVLTIDPRAYGRDESGLDDRSSRLIRRTQGGTVAHRNNGVQIGGWQLWEDRTVSVETPNPGHAIVDFYPHPYHFNGHVRIWIDLTYVVLPPGVNWWDLQMFYQDENGNLQQYWGQLDLVNHQYIAWTDHFSRYIIGARINH